jgi:hypothetical protein
MKPSELREGQWIKLRVASQFRRSGAIGFHKHRGEFYCIAIDRDDPVTDMGCGIEILNDLQLMDAIYERWKECEAIEVLTSED